MVLKSARRSLGRSTLCTAGRRHFYTLPPSNLNHRLQATVSIDSLRVPDTAMSDREAPLWEKPKKHKKPKSANVLKMIKESELSCSPRPPPSICLGLDLWHRPPLKRPRSSPC